MLRVAATFAVVVLVRTVSAASVCGEEDNGIPVTQVEEEDRDNEAAAATVLFLQTRAPALMAASTDTLDAQRTPDPEYPINSTTYPDYPRADELARGLIIWRGTTRKLNQLSMEQANMTCSDVSFFGAAVPKFPQSFVANATALKRTISEKTSTYNFQGSLYSDPETIRRRQWVLPFAETHFADTDVLKITDAPANHTLLGPWDHTNETSGSYRPKDHPSCDRLIPFDVEYYRAMAVSTFTLCPGGDSPWSMRFYEAILAGSIPVIHSEVDDFNGNYLPFWLNGIGYTYYTKSQVVSLQATSTELERVADQNYELLLKYQTWVEGDQVPPGYAAFSDPCLSYSTCSKDCYCNQCDPQS